MASSRVPPALRIKYWYSLNPVITSYPQSMLINDPFSWTKEALRPRLTWTKSKWPSTLMNDVKLMKYSYSYLKMWKFKPVQNRGHLFCVPDDDKNSHFLLPNDRLRVGATRTFFFMGRGADKARLLGGAANRKCRHRASKRTCLYDHMLVFMLMNSFKFTFALIYQEQLYTNFSLIFTSHSLVFD